MPNPLSINKTSRDYDQEILNWIGQNITITHHTALGEKNITGKLVHYKPKNHKIIIQTPDGLFIPTQEWTITLLGKRKK